MTLWRRGGMVGAMADHNSIGPRSAGDALGIEGVASRKAPSTARTGGGPSGGGVTGIGRRGMRMLPPGTDVEALDRKVPRGTYVDLLV